MKCQSSIVIGALVAMSSLAGAPCRAIAQDRPIVPRQPFVVYKVDITDFSGKGDMPIKDFAIKKDADDYAADRRDKEPNWQRWNYLAMERPRDTTGGNSVNPKPNRPDERPNATGASGGPGLGGGLSLTPGTKFADLPPLGGSDKIYLELRPDGTFQTTGKYTIEGKWRPTSASTVYLETPYMRFAGKIDPTTKRVKGVYNRRLPDGSLDRERPEQDPALPMVMELKSDVPAKVNPETPAPKAKQAAQAGDAAELANSAWVHRTGPFTQVGYVGPLMHEEVTVLLDDGRFVVLASYFIPLDSFRSDGVNARPLSEQGKWQADANGLIKMTERTTSASRTSPQTGSFHFRVQDGQLRAGGLNGAYFEANAQLQRRRLSSEQTTEAILRAKKANW